MEKKNKNIYTFFFKMLLIFVALDAVMMLVSGILTSSSLFAKYGMELINEMFYAIAVLVVMLLFKNSYVFTERKTKFWTSITYGLPILIISGITFIGNLVTLKSFTLPNFVNALVLCIFVGIAEEFLCRGWLQNEFIERFSDDKESVIKSIILASLVFGVMHIINVFEQTLFETILQIINAVAVGVLLGSIYYKTKNIWSVIFLHAFYDFSIFLGEMNLVKDCTYGTPTFAVTVINCISILFISALWIFSALKVLNKIKEKGIKIDKKKDCFYTTMIVISFIFALIPFEKLVPDYDKYETCYDYIEIDSFSNYEEHYPHFNRYYIDESEEVSKFEEDGFNTTLKEVISKEQYLISFTLFNNETVNIKNENTTYEVKLPFDEVNHLELIENEEDYIVIIQSLENESTIYYSKINKSDLRNSKDFIDFISGSFKEFALPNLSRIGYITLEHKEEKYPYFISSNGDEFMIRSGNIYLIK